MDARTHWNLFASLACALLLSAPCTSRSAAAEANTPSGAEDFSHPAGRDWPIAGGDWNNTRYSTLDQINTHSVTRLGAVWLSEKFDEGGTSRVTPIVRDGLMFVSAGRKVYALNPKTGARVWSYQTVPDMPPVGRVPVAQPAEGAPTLPDEVPNDRGVGVGGGLVFVGLRDGNVIALDERTGALQWVRQTGAEQPKKGQWAAVPPLYYNGNILTGLSNGDTFLRGRLTELDAVTGHERWRLFTIPAPGDSGHESWPALSDVWKVGGGGVWSNLAVDPALGVVYATTGNAVPMFAGDVRPGNNLYTCSVLAVSATTGTLQWYYQLVHHDVFDGDIGTPVILYDAHVGGQVHKALAALRADGYLYQLDRRTGAPLLPVKERPVPQLRSQATAPTQPFPVGGESILMSCEDWKKETLPAGFVLGCMWTAPASPTDPQNVLAPFPSVRATPMAYSPQTEYFYAQGTSMLGWPRRAADPFFFDFGSTIPGLHAYKELAAIDSHTGKIAWRRRIRASVIGGLPIHLSGGPLVTAGGLLFQSLGDGNFAALDAGSGSVLWRFQTGMGGAGGAPASYAIDGEQYVAVPMGRAIWTFKLGGTLPGAADPAILTEEAFSGPVIDTSQIETTTLDSSTSGSGTRYFVDEYTFHPYRARVAVGTEVLFVNNGDIRHEIVATDGSWGTGPLSPTQEARVRFDKPGRYIYICKDHPWVYGQISVEATNTTAAGKRDSQPTAPIELHSNSPDVQTRRGKEQFDRNCSTCHGVDLNGRATAPPLSGSTFMLHWQSAAVGDLFDRIRTTMPQAKPGSLDRQTYLDIVAYLLRANDAAAASGALEDDPYVLKKLTVQGYHNPLAAQPSTRN